MGKMTSIYLTDEEATELKKFGEENQCTQYSVLKTALREVLSKKSDTTERNKPRNRSELEVETIESPEKNSINIRKLLQSLIEP